jgi:hypothetical protein
MLALSDENRPSSPNESSNSKTRPRRKVLTRPLPGIGVFTRSKIGKHGVRLGEHTRLRVVTLLGHSLAKQRQEIRSRQAKGRSSLGSPASSPQLCASIVRPLKRVRRASRALVSFITSRRGAAQHHGLPVRRSGPCVSFHQGEAIRIICESPARSRSRTARPRDATAASARRAASWQPPCAE